MQIGVGDLCSMKKKHPCGANRFELLRVGADVKLRCTGCGREIWMTRGDFTKAVKLVERVSPQEDGEG